MNEKLFQYIWQHLYFNVQHLKTASGQQVEIIFRGTLNTNQGPDFLNARVRIDETIWVGNIELHLEEKDWVRHGHQNDFLYQNVILHVVAGKLEEQPVTRIPTISLEGRIPKHLLARYSSLYKNPESIACKPLLNNLPSITFIQCLDRMLVEKWEHRFSYMQSLLKINRFHFEEAFWWMLAGNFGTPVNTQAFEMMARSIPFKILQSVRHDATILEALLMGQIGLLDQVFGDPYPAYLKTEYRFLKHKHQLKKGIFPVSFLRMRPANFPTIRLVQLASLMNKHERLFSEIKDCNSLNDLYGILSAQATGYWENHYHFGQPTLKKQKMLGKEMINNLLINTILPVLYGYGKINRIESMQLRAMDWLRMLPPENNAVTRLFIGTPFPNESAYDSQALIHLKKNYCNQKRCLKCAVGHKLLAAVNANYK
ncbi:MAG: DUF2851 family protein [Ferruginibacter sp.]|nr:DUF2851 family protein [Ferruginibacter sp.]